MEKGREANDKREGEENHKGENERRRVVVK